MAAGNEKDVAPDRPSVIPGVFRRCPCKTLFAQTALLAHGTTLHSTPVGLIAFVHGPAQPRGDGNQKLRESTLHANM